MIKFNNNNLFKNYICPNPFIYAELKTKGEVGTCCYITSFFGNLNTSTLKDIWNSHALLALRQSIIDGDYSYCDSSKCSSMQAVLQPESDTFKYQVPYQLIKRNTANSRVINEYLKKHSNNTSLPEIISFEDDDSCNLSCPSCRTSLNLLTLLESKSKLQIQIELLNSIGTDVKELWFCGAGDPFAAKSYKELLSTYNFDQFPDVKIRLDTNGILLNKTTWNTILKNLHHKIDLIAVSVDAVTDKTYALIRRGGNFSLLKKNLLFISSLRERGYKFSYVIRMIVQKHNYKEMKRFAELGLSLGVDSILFFVIQNWGTFTKEEYLDQAVHQKEHELYNDFCYQLEDDIFFHPQVDLGNLTELHHELYELK